MGDWEDEFGDGMAGKENNDNFEWPVCPYCGAKAKLVDSKIIYGRSYGPVYICGNFPRCDSYVGVHKGTNRPLGTMANAELRKERNKAHKAFDPLWQQGKIVRSRAYAWLASRLKIPVDKCHIGMFDADTCKKVVQIMEE